MGYECCEIRAVTGARLPAVIFMLLLVFTGIYQQILRPLVYVQSGVGRTLQPISEFPYSCRRLRDPGLEACEDMWLSESTRQLFLACSDASSRREWMPNVGRLNASGRSQQDKIVALDLDKPVGDSFSYRVLSTPGYTGTNGDGKLNLVAISGIDHPKHIDLFLNNNRPSTDAATGQLLDSTKVGANATIELFRITKPLTSKSAEFVKTFVDPQIATPNNIAPTNSGSFYFTNDHGINRAGLWHTLSPMISSGDVSFCPAEGPCKRVARGYSFPNGLVLGRKDGLLYVPSSSLGTITAYAPQPDGNLEELETIKTDYPLDNISEDKNGDYWVPGIPNLGKMMDMFDDPLGDSKSPATVFRIRRRSGGKKGYEVKKMLEDSESEILPAATTVVHDAKTGRLFLSGIVSPFVSVCERKNSLGEGRERQRDEL